MAKNNYAEELLKWIKGQDKREYNQFVDAMVKSDANPQETISHVVGFLKGFDLNASELNQAATALYRGIKDQRTAIAHDPNGNAKYEIRDTKAYENYLRNGGYPEYDFENVEDEYETDIPEYLDVEEDESEQQFSGDSEDYTDEELDELYADEIKEAEEQAAREEAEYYSPEYWGLNPDGSLPDGGQGDAQ